MRDKADDNPFFAEAEKYLDLGFTFSGSRVLAIMMGETFELSCRVDGSQVTLSAEDASPILTFTYENDQLYLDAEDGVTLIFSRQGPLEI